MKPGRVREARRRTQRRQLALLPLRRSRDRGPAAPSPHRPRSARFPRNPSGQLRQTESCGQTDSRRRRGRPPRRRDGRRGPSRRARVESMRSGISQSGCSGQAGRAPVAALQACAAALAPVPELPEVEVTRRQLEPLLVGRRVARVVTTVPSYFFLTPPAVLRRRLPGRRFDALDRVGKYLLARLDNGERLLLHLGMTGQIFGAGVPGVRLLSSTRRRLAHARGAAAGLPAGQAHAPAAALRRRRPRRLLPRRAQVRQGAAADGRRAPRSGSSGSAPTRSRASGTRALRGGPHAPRADQDAAARPVAARRRRQHLRGRGALPGAACGPTRPGRRVTRAECERIAARHPPGAAALDRDRRQQHQRLRPARRQLRRLPGRAPRLRPRGRALPALPHADPRRVLGQRSSHYCPSCQT